MKVRTSLPADLPARPDLLVGLAFEGARPKLGAALEDMVRAARASGDLRTGAREVSLFHHAGRSGPRRLAFVGMGPKGKATCEDLRRAAAIAQARAEELGVAEVVLWMEGAALRGIDAAAAGRVAAEGLILGAYRYEPPRKEKSKPRKAQRAVLVLDGEAQDDFRAGVRVGIAGAEGAVLARELGDLPANICTPKYLAAQARKLAGQRLQVKVLDGREMKRRGMGALLGVSRGSSEGPALIALDYRPARAKRTVCVIGKGVTFDSGGISIKPSARMDEMRYDMCGGAAVIGLLAALKTGALRGSPDRTRVVGVIPACENLPDAAAQKPGDVVTACDGTTIEVLNTDAEGRLILSDAIAWARKTYKPAAIVDMATLTGAVIVALGHEAAAVLGNDDDLIAALIEAGRASDEPCWRLPLWEVHREQCKSKFADIANINAPGHGGGTINGAAFLSHFVGDTPWAHLDIAGTAWGGRARDYHAVGASGTPVRALVQWLRGLG